jgi:hypothetical protein
MSSSVANPHSEYIDKRIEKLQMSDRLRTKITDTTHDIIIKDFSCHLFTDLIQTTFTTAYLRKHVCSDCGGKSEHRCHGAGEERGELLKRALERVFPDTTKIISLKEIAVAFLEEHKTTRFTFKCKVCHDKEPRPKKTKK